MCYMSDCVRLARYGRPKMQHCTRRAKVIFAHIINDVSVTLKTNIVIAYMRGEMRGLESEMEKSFSCFVSKA